MKLTLHRQKQKKKKLDKAISEAGHVSDSPNAVTPPTKSVNLKSITPPTTTEIEGFFRV